MFSKFKIGTRLFAAFAVLIVIAATIGIVGLSTADRMNANAVDMYDVQLQGLSYIKEANIDLIAIGRARNEYFLATSEEERASIAARIKERLANVRTNVDKAKPTFKSEVMQGVLAEFERIFEPYQAEIARNIELASKQAFQKRDETLAQSLERARAQANEIDKLMTNLAERKEPAPRKQLMKRLPPINRAVCGSLQRSSLALQSARHSPSRSAAVSRSRSRAQSMQRTVWRPAICRSRSTRPPRTKPAKCCAHWPE